MADALISELLKNATRPLLSYEFFPPRDEKGIERLKLAAGRLLDTGPDFVTCTWGAGGSTRERSLEICDLLRAMGFGPVMPHLTCVGASRSELAGIADEMYARGYRNVMALRGDPPMGEKRFVPHPEGLAHASDLVRLLKERHPDLCCGVAGYPETHLESANRDADTQFLKLKVDAGADFITSQLFFDNRFFFDFIPRCRDAGIDLPVVAGRLPAMSLKQVQRFTSMCGSSFPPELSLSMSEAGGTGEGAERAGIGWASCQIEQLLDHKVDGIHLYVLNRSKAAMAPDVKRCFERVRG
jgi:methylenetetrahydrofolate reductase (NADPH)